MIKTTWMQQASSRPIQCSIHWPILDKRYLSSEERLVSSWSCKQLYLFTFIIIIFTQCVFTSCNYVVKYCTWRNYWVKFPFRIQCDMIDVIYVTVNSGNNELLEPLNSCVSYIIVLGKYNNPNSDCKSNCILKNKSHKSILPSSSWGGKCAALWKIRGATEWVCNGFEYFILTYWQMFSWKARPRESDPTERNCPAGGTS